MFDVSLQVSPILHMTSSLHTYPCCTARHNSFLLVFAMNLVSFSTKTCSKTSIYFFTSTFRRGHLKQTCISDLSCTVLLPPHKSKMEKYASDMVLGASTFLRQQSLKKTGSVTCTCRQSLSSWCEGLHVCPILHMSSSLHAYCLSLLKRAAHFLFTFFL